MISKSHSIPQYGSISRLIGFSVSVLADDILYGIELCSAMISVYDNLCPPQLGLLFSIHNMIGVYVIISVVNLLLCLILKLRVLLLA